MKPNHETIYLVPTDYDGGQLTYSWCDCPAPGEGMDPEDAIKYVRADLVPASNEVLAKRIAELTNERDALSKQVNEQLNVIEHIAKAVGEEADPMACWEAVDALKAQVEQLQKQKEQLLLGFDEYKQMQNIADAEIKAQAVSEVWKHFNGKFRQNEKLTVMEVCVMLNNHVGYLRQQAKAGAV